MGYLDYPQQITFERYRLKNPITIMFSACAFLKNWAGLYAEEDKEFIKNGAQQLAFKAMEIIKRREAAGSQGVATSEVLRITGV